MKPLASTLLILAITAATAKADITWNWSVTSGFGVASGTFTTAGTTPAAGTTYTITAITGTFEGAAITGLIPGGASTNTFQWDGTNTSPLLVSTADIRFTRNAAPDVLFDNTIGGYMATNVVSITSVGQGGVIASSLVPVLSSGAPDAGLSAAADGAFQIRYASNLAIGDSVINMTNDGASSTGAGLTDAANNFQQYGQLCANVYAYSPDEQLVSCCSCNVTPNGLNSLSVKNDLASNTLTPIIPSALVIKILVTEGGSRCTASTAATANTLPRGAGLLAWGTTIHAAPVSAGAPAGTFAVTETPFAIGQKNDEELKRMAGLCAFIRGNGSGYGICKSCKIGGLGGSAK